MPVSVALIGFMGSGKSTVGALIAERMGLPFVDLDRLIVAREGHPISELFSCGEARFRAAERRALGGVLAGPAAVLACGGGTLTLSGALRDLERWGVTIFLEVPLASIQRRLADDRSARPLWGDDALRRLGERLPLYRSAQLTVDADRAPAAVAQAILSALALR